MGKVNLYYLVARNKRDNSVTVVPVNGYECGSLEDIDLFTMRYKNEMELSYDLLEKGLISSIPVDLFITNQSKGEMYNQEVIYSYAKEIRGIAESSKKNQISSCLDDIDTILDSFSYKMRYNQKFYEMMVSTDTNIYPSFIDFYIDNCGNRDVLYHAKYQRNSFPRKSYKLIRNIVEANNRFETYRYTGYNINRNDFYRRLLKDKLISITDKNYISNQLSLLDEYESADKEDDDKLFNVLGIFDRVSRREFTEEHGELIINKNEFDMCSESDLKKLDGLRGEQLLILLYRLSRANELFQVEIADNTRSEIMRILNNDKMSLEMAYQWCNIYNKYKNVYGDVDGYQYKKSE